MSVGGRVEIALYWAESPSGGGGGGGGGNWGRRQVSAVEARLLLDLAPDPESGTSGDLGERRCVRPPGEL